MIVFYSCSKPACVQSGYSQLQLTLANQINGRKKNYYIAAYVASYISIAMSDHGIDLFPGLLHNDVCYMAAI